MFDALILKWITNIWIRFERIRKAELAFPVTLGNDAHDVMRCLLDKRPHTRLGAGPCDVEEIKSHAFYQKTDWNRVLARDYDAPFVPHLEVVKIFHIKI